MMIRTATFSRTVQWIGREMTHVIVVGLGHALGLLIWTVFFAG
jgi:hypothetical protein